MQPLALAVRPGGEQDGDDAGFSVREGSQDPAPLTMLHCNTVSNSGGKRRSVRLKEGDIMILLEQHTGVVQMGQASRNRTPVLGTILVAGLMVFVLASTTAGATSLPATPNAAGSWSYGVVKTITVPPAHTSGGWVYEGNATFGYTVTIYENSTSAHTSELTVYRTMGASYTIRFCQLSCSTPTQWANQSFRLYEATATFANFTDQGTVRQNGTTSVSAIALENTASFLHANLTETSDVYLPTLGEMGPHLRYLGADLTGASSVVFSPALGLFPTNLVAGSTWNSSSEFAESGAWAYTYYYAVHAPMSKSFILGPFPGNGSLTTHGNISVQGAYPTGSVFEYGGATYPAIVLTVKGPFDVREGVIFVPSSIDVFGSSSQAWSNNATGAATAQMATLDLKPSSGAELQLVASSWQYSSNTANAATSPTFTPSSSGLAPASGTSTPISSATVQGVPESSQQATGAQQCLTTGNGCPSLGGGPNIRGLIGLVVLSGLVVTVATVVALAVVTRRRKVPPPVYPNAVLYPPGAAYPSAPAGTPAPPATPPPPDDDPLDHLW